jgi:hypothetical protein
MTNDERPTFVAALVALAETFKEPMSPGRIEGYCRGLDDLPLARLLEGIDEAQATCEFFPKPGTIRKLACPPKEYYLNQSAYTSAPVGPPPVRQALPSPVNMGELAGAIVKSLEATAEAHRAKLAADAALTPAQVAARKAELREQLKRIVGSE